MGDSSLCDQNGCGLNPFRYGAGTDYQLDSFQVFTVVTQFHADSDTGSLMNISRFYLQNEKRVDLPTLYVVTPTDGSEYGPFRSPSITKDYCADIYDRWDGNVGDAPLAQMGKNMENGMVLAMSAWYDAETYVNGVPAGGEEQTGMSWLDGINQWGGHSVKAGPCDADTADAGAHYATFSNIRIGDIGTTLCASTCAPTPAPTPAPPALPTPPPTPSPPPPSSGQCCYDGCPGSSCQGGWCGESKGNCEGSCNGQWCPGQLSTQALRGHKKH